MITQLQKWLANFAGFTTTIVLSLRNLVLSLVNLSVNSVMAIVNLGASLVMGLYNLLALGLNTLSTTLSAAATSVVQLLAEMNATVLDFIKPVTTRIPFLNRLSQPLSRLNPAVSTVLQSVLLVSMAPYAVAAAASSAVFGYLFVTETAVLLAQALISRSPSLTRAFAGPRVAAKLASFQARQTFNSVINHPVAQIIRNPWRRLFGVRTVDAFGASADIVKHRNSIATLEQNLATVQEVMDHNQGVLGRLRTRTERLEETARGHGNEHEAANKAFRHIHKQLGSLSERVETNDKRFVEVDSKLQTLSNDVAAHAEQNVHLQDLIAEIKAKQEVHPQSTTSKILSFVNTATGLVTGSPDSTTDAKVDEVAPEALGVVQEEPRRAPSPTMQ